ncbi:formate/nitrite transporter family protein [Defluviimonas sp. WL0024]|uniref:Formate/nitrite transporter family protein n=1 Tax=Albidovulum salinarum TaxID=2984153 RepID=A0ABT2XEW5_9RHOB|nr:formate/nitrite transporter family protein [Defluviimonas sp. WL0024]MCU9850225.1 formate/nitrite transporter family protein [Defluviimonas sp. WL0024]
MPQRNGPDEAQVEQAEKLTSAEIYEVVRRYGDEELARSNSSLVWSGIAAGLLMSLSLLGEAILRTYLPDAQWRHLVENLGYSFGFIAVILGRMQLFTENTLTTILPLMAKPTPRMAGNVLRLWSIVLGANVAGTFVAAGFFAYTQAVPDEILHALRELSEHAVLVPAGEGFVKAIPAGVLIAAIVWMLPQAENVGLFVVLMFTWLIAAGDFAHIVAGSVEMAYLVVIGFIDADQAVGHFFVPVLAGNIVGGTAIFATLAWVQVHADI